MWSTFQRPGDILFTTLPSFGGKINLLAQKIMFWRKVKATHVILCIAPGLYIHSNKVRGVEFDTAEDFPIAAEKNNKDRFLSRTVRPRFAKNDPDFFVDLMDKSLYFYRQKYNSLFFTKNTLASKRFRKSAAFCSEFVSVVYRGIGKPLLNLPDEQVFPATLEACLIEPDWEDVTDIYQQGLADTKAAQDRQPFAEPLRITVLGALQTNFALIEMIATTNRVGELLNELAESGEVELAQKLVEPIEQLVSVPTDWVERQFDHLNSMIEYKQLDPLYFSQDIDPQLATSNVGCCYRRF